MFLLLVTEALFHLWAFHEIYRVGVCLTGELEAGGTVLDVGTEDVDTELATYNGSHWLSADNRQARSLRCDSLVTKRRRLKQERLERLNAINARHCDQFVMYGSDVRSVVDFMSMSAASSSWSSNGYVNCYEAQLGGPLWPCSMPAYWKQMGSLKDACCTPEDHLERLRDVLDRYDLFFLQRYSIHLHAVLIVCFKECGLHFLMNSHFCFVVYCCSCRL